MLKIIKDELDWNSIRDNPLILCNVIKRVELGPAYKFVERIIHETAVLIVNNNRKAYINFSNDESEAIIFYSAMKDLVLEINQNTGEIEVVFKPIGGN